MSLHNNTQIGPRGLFLMPYLNCLILWCIFCCSCVLLCTQARSNCVKITNGGSLNLICSGYNTYKKLSSRTNEVSLNFIKIIDSWSVRLQWRMIIVSTCMQDLINIIAPWYVQSKVTCSNGVWYYRGRRTTRLSSCKWMTRLVSTRNLWLDRASNFAARSTPAGTRKISRWNARHCQFTLCVYTQLISMANDQFFGNKCTHKQSAPHLPSSAHALSCLSAEAGCDSEPDSLSHTCFDRVCIPRPQPPLSRCVLAQTRIDFLCEEGFGSLSGNLSHGTWVYPSTSATTHLFTVVMTTWKHVQVHHA